jgi:hypothetical protein
MSGLLNSAGWRTMAENVTPEFWAILGIGVPVMAVGGSVMFAGLQCDVTRLRERLAKLEGAVDPERGDLQTGSVTSCR